MAIMSILIALLIPAVNSAREQSRSAQCSNNARQLTLAWLQYADNNKGMMMPITTWIDDPTITSLQRYWFGQVMPATTTGGTSTIDFNQGFLVPYMEGNPDTYRCPSFNEENVSKLRFNRMITGYAYNYQYLGPGPKVNYDTNFVGTYVPSIPMSNRLSSVKSSSHTIVFADSAVVNCADYPNCTQASLTENWYLAAPSQGYPTVHFRHNGDVANVAFADGHVEKFTWQTPTFPSGFNSDQANFSVSQRLGFIGTDDSYFWLNREVVH
jgi:prepilin-type processing-associated H-X9-DG protein